MRIGLVDMFTDVYPKFCQRRFEIFFISLGFTWQQSRKNAKNCVVLAIFVQRRSQTAVFTKQSGKDKNPSDKMLIRQRLTCVPNADSFCAGVFAVAALAFYGKSPKYGQKLRNYAILNFLNTF